MAIYHVTRSWDGCDLLSLQQRMPWGDVARAEVEAKWSGTDPLRYYRTEGEWVHCHATLPEAVAYRDEFCEGGVILAIDDDGLDVAEGDEYPHPVVLDLIPADRISVAGVDD